MDGGGFTSPPPTDRDVTLSYLPLCHVAERIFTTWFNAAVGVQVNFAESIETVPANLREVQPTILFGVPRIWEKVLAGVTIRAARLTAQTAGPPVLDGARRPDRRAPGRARRHATRPARAARTRSAT